MFYLTFPIFITPFPLNIEAEIITAIIVLIPLAIIFQYILEEYVGDYGPKHIVAGGTLISVIWAIAEYAVAGDMNFTLYALFSGIALTFAGAAGYASKHWDD